MFTTGDKPHNKYEFNYDIIDHFIVIPLENVENTKMNIYYIYPTVTRSPKQLPNQLKQYKIKRPNDFKGVYF